MNKTLTISIFVILSAVLPVFTGFLTASAGPVAIRQSAKVGDGIVEFIPEGFDPAKTPSLILKDEPVALGTIPADWKLIPSFTLTNGKASASLTINNEISLYGGGEVTGPLLRNGQAIKLWNTDTGAYGVDGGKRLYQSHPWVLGVRRDGTAFGIIFDSSWKSELITNSGKIEFNTEGALFRIYIIDRASPKEVLKGLAELTGTIGMPARWTLGYHQCRFSYGTEKRVREIADTFRAKNLPCDVIWMDIDYMDGYRVFTFNNTNFPDPRSLNDDLHKKGFKAVYMIDPGVKVDTNYDVYLSGKEHDVWVKRPDGQEYHGKVWPGDCAFPDFTMPHARDWWAGLYKDFLAKGIDGVWNDMNEPAVNDSELPEAQRLGTMPYDTPHRGGGDLPAGPHLLYHNAYGRLMVEASLKGIMEVNPDKRPFLLTRANLLGGQRYAATWTGDNWAGWDHLKLSVPMSLTLGLSGQPFSGPDIGGFLNNTSGDLWAHWLGFGVFLPFVRGHACAGTNDKEPWAFGEAIEKSSRIALERRYRLLPYIYTLFYDAHKTGIPVMSPVFFANPQDLRLRSEQEAFLLGDNLMVIPAFAENPVLPFGIWEELTLIEGEKQDQYQAKLKIKGGSIIPAGKVIQNTNEKSFEPLTLFVCPDENGNAEGTLYWDEGDGWSFQCGDYSLMTFRAVKTGNVVKVSLATTEGQRAIGKDIDKINVELLVSGKVYKGSGTLKNGVTVAL
jgi:alpha-glucosidase